MGQAKNRGTKEERIASATPKKEKMSAAERQAYVNNVIMDVMSRMSGNSMENEKLLDTVKMGIDLTNKTRGFK